MSRVLGFYPFRCQSCGRRFWRRRASVPEEESDEDRREYIRLPAQILIGLRWADGDGEGTLSDVSIAGGGIMTRAPVPEGVLVRLTLRPSPDGPAVEVEKAVVRSANPGRLGVEFTDIAADERARLADLIQQLLAGTPGPAAPGPAGTGRTRRH